MDAIYHVDGGRVLISPNAASPGEPIDATTRAVRSSTDFIVAQRAAADQAKLPPELIRIVKNWRSCLTAVKGRRRVAALAARAFPRRPGIRKSGIGRDLRFDSMRGPRRLWVRSVDFLCDFDDSAHPLAAEGTAATAKRVSL